jgi:hypothetical protein
MVRFFKRHALGILLAGCGLCLVGVGMLAGTLVAVMNRQPQPTFELPLFATATDTGVSMSMATGPVDDEVEGVFFLDFVSGELTCAVLNSRTGKPGGFFRTNVIKALGIVEEKKPAYLMTTGSANFVGFKVGTKQPSLTVVYVCDQTTGRFAGYTFMWDRTLASRGAMQQGEFLPPLIAASAKAVQVEE